MQTIVCFINNLLDNNTALQYNKKNTRRCLLPTSTSPWFQPPTVATVKYVQPNYWVYPKNLVSHLLRTDGSLFLVLGFVVSEQGVNQSDYATNISNDT